MNWIDKLQHKWQLKSAKQVILVLIVFACTGLTVMFLKKPVISFLTDGESANIWFSVVYYLLILPIYNIILLLYGFIFGQFRFFWSFEKRMLSRFKRREP